jgi:putative ABC transport system ATP-binding protein
MDADMSETPTNRPGLFRREAKPAVVPEGLRRAAPPAPDPTPLRSRLKLSHEPATVRPTEYAVQARALVKRYRMGEVETTVLNSVDLGIERGQFVAVMGPSGSGKSTLLHLLGGLDRPTSGEVFVAGRALSKLSDDDLTLLRRRRIGFIFQSFNLLPTLTAEENVALPLLADGRPPANDRVRDLLDLVRLGDRREYRPDQLSGGQQQRVAIARALVTDPDLILADEPTGNLDSKSGSIVLETLRKICDGLGATIVMVTHDPRAASFADRAIYVKDGQIVTASLNERDGHDVARIAGKMAELEGEG